MTVSTTQAFLDLLAKSELLGPEQLAQARDTAAKVEDPKTLARLLLQKGLLTRWQATQLLAGRSSFRLGKYKLIDLLGRGGMGSVFVAEHTTMNRRVALKIISKELGRDPASLERFLVEARAIAALDHPNIVHAYNVDNEGDRYYMVMEFVEGQDLQRMVEAEGPLDFQRAVDYVRQAADGLAHAHSRKMIHCDIKPANLIVNHQGVVKILDMGMARLVGREGVAQGQDERVLGTVDYLAPEQAMGSPELDHRVDIYSLGCTFYFLLTGRPPFPEGTLAERIVKHQTQTPRSILEMRPDTPRELVKICQKMMAKQPEKRFQSAEEISRLLEGWRPPKTKLLRAVPLEEEASAKEASVVAAPLEADTPSASRSNESPAPPSSQRRRPGRRQIVLLGGIGGGVLVILAAVLIALFATKGEETAARKNAPKRIEAKAPGSGEKAKKEEDDESDDSWLDVKIPPPDPDFDPTKIPLAEPKPTPAASDKPPGKPADNAEAKAKEKTEAKPAAKAKNTTTSPPAEKPGPKPAKKSTPESSDKQSAKPNDEPSAKPADQPAAKAVEKPAEKPAAQSKPAPEEDPLRGVPKAVDLPELGKEGADQPFELAKVFTPADVGWRLWLFGGENALRSNRLIERRFVFEEAETEPAKARWEVQLEEQPSDGQPTRSDVATLWRDGDSLQFQWAKDADPASANFLRNCILEIRAEDKSAYLQLVQPKVVEPIVIDLHKGVARLTVHADYLPDPASIRMQITKVEGRDDYTLEPAEPAEIKTPISLSFVRTDRDGNQPDKVEFQIHCTTRGSGLEVDMNGMVVAMSPRGARVRVGAVFKPFSLAAIQQNLTALREQKKAREDSFNDNRKNLRGEKRSRVLGELRAIERQLWYVEFFESVHTKTKIHFSIYMQAGKHKTILVTTES